MTKSKTLPEQPPEGLFEGAVQLAKALGIDWGSGGGVYCYSPDGAAPVWRVYSDWAGTGAIVDVDVVSGEVVRVQEQDFERLGRMVMPERFRPSEAEVLAFLRTIAGTLGWTWPANLVAEWDNDIDVWRIRTADAPAGQGIRAEVRGKRSHLRLAGISRV